MDSLIPKDLHLRTGAFASPHVPAAPWGDRPVLVKAGDWHVHTPCQGSLPARGTPALLLCHHTPCSLARAAVHRLLLASCRLAGPQAYGPRLHTSAIDDDFPGPLLARCGSLSCHARCCMTSSLDDSTRDGDRSLCQLCTRLVVCADSDSASQPSRCAWRRTLV